MNDSVLKPNKIISFKGLESYFIQIIPVTFINYNFDISWMV